MALKNLIQKRREIQVDLQKTTLEEILNFGSKKEIVGMNLYGSEEIYIDKIVDDQHLYLEVDTNEKWLRPIYEIQYFPAQKKVVINTQYKRSPWLYYLYLVLPCIALVGGDSTQRPIIFISIFILMFFGITAFLYFAIRSNSKEMERELIIRINNARR